MFKNLDLISCVNISFSELVQVCDVLKCCKALESGIIFDAETFFSPDISLVTSSNGLRIDTISSIREFLLVVMIKSFRSKMQSVVRIASFCYRYNTKNSIEFEHAVRVCVQEC